MKRILIILILSFNFCNAQVTMVDGAFGEYSIGWIGSDTYVYNPQQVVYNTTYRTRRVAGTLGTVQGDGGQYHSVYRRSNGTVFDIFKHENTINEYPLDYNGAAFTCDKVYALWRMNLALKDGEVWYWSGNNGVDSLEDMLEQFGAVTDGVPVPRKLIQPAGSKNITKLVFGSAPFPYNGATLWGIADDGTMWQWSKGVTTPIQVTGKVGEAGSFSGTVVNAAFLGLMAQVVYTSTNNFYTWGINGHVTGGKDNWQSAPMDDISGRMGQLGIVFPLKKVEANYLVCYVIDANDHLWGIGVNQNGNIGNGYMAPSWRTHYNGTRSNVYAYDFNIEHGLDSTWRQIPGKWSNIKTNSSFVFYAYGQDMNGNWYSWGRNKGKSLGNAETWGALDQGTFPEYYDVPAPRLVTPISDSVWVVSPTDGNLDTAAARIPIANASINQYLVNGTTSTTLYGEGSHQQQPTNSLTVTMTNAWTLTSGANIPTITSPTSQNTTVTGMIAGTYIFRNTVTNSVGANDYQEVTVVVSGVTPPSTSDNLRGGIYRN